MKKTLLKLAPATLAVAFSANLYADVHSSDHADLDDIRGWGLVSVETCLDAALDTVPGNARKLELKMEGDDPAYEFEIEAIDGMTYNVECNAEEGFITEIERTVSADDATFKKYAKISEAEARATALDFNPGKVVENEYEIGMDGSVTYEYDIQTKLGYEVKVDVNAITGEIEEANIELYEIGMEKE
jgi:uncharacterized membrane protein YkoI